MGQHGGHGWFVKSRIVEQWGQIMTGEELEIVWIGNFLLEFHYKEKQRIDTVTS